MLERYLPGFLESAHDKVELDYIPKIYAFLRWIPFVWNYIPTEEDYLNGVERRTNRNTEGFFSQNRDRAATIVTSMRTKRSFKHEDGFEFRDSICESRFEVIQEEESDDNEFDE